MTLALIASVQYNDMTGSVATDDADFERLGQILGVPASWHVVGLSIYGAHPSLGIEGKDHADSSYTGLTLWAIDDAHIVPGEGIPGLFASNSPVDVAEFTFDMSDNEYPSPADAISVLLRASKRLSIVLWDRAVPRPLRDDMMTVTSAHTMVWSGERWVEQSAD